MRTGSVLLMALGAFLAGLPAQDAPPAPDEGWLEVLVARRPLALGDPAAARLALTATSASLRRVNFLAEGESGERAQLQALSLLLGREKEVLLDIERMLQESAALGSKRGGFTHRLTETRDALRRQRLTLDGERARVVSARAAAVTAFTGLPSEALSVRRSETGSEALAVRTLISAAGEDEKLFRERVTALSRGMATRVQELQSVEQSRAVAEAGLDALVRDTSAAEASGQSGAELWTPREREFLARLELRRFELAAVGMEGDALEVRGLEMEVVQLQQDEAATRRDALQARLKVLEEERGAAAEVEDQALAAEALKLAGATAGSEEWLQHRRLVQRRRTLQFELELEAVQSADAADGERALVALRTDEVMQRIDAARKGDPGALPVEAEAMRRLRALLLADGHTLRALEEARTERLKSIRMEPRMEAPLGRNAPESAALDSARDALLSALESSRAAAHQQLARIESAERELGPRALWMRSRSDASRDSIARAWADLPELPRSLPGIVGGELAGWWAVASDPLNLRGTFLMAGVMAVFVLASVMLRRRLPETFSWMEAHQHGTSGRMWRLLAAWLRRTHLSLIIAVGYAAVRGVGGGNPLEGPLAVVFFTPFAWQALHVARQLLFDPASTEGRALQVSTSVALALHRTSGRLIWFSLATVPAGLLLEQTGYTARNAGFLDLWWLATSLGILAILLVQALRPGLLADWVRGNSARSATLRGVLAILWPLLTCSLLALFLLHAFRFEAAARRMQTAWLEAGALAVAAGLIYALLFGNMLGRLEFRNVRRDECEDDAAFVAANARRATGLLKRLLVRTLVFGPAIGLIFVVLSGTLEEAVAPAVLEARAFTLSADIAASVLTLAIGIILIRHAARMLRFVVLPRTQMEPGVQFATATLATYGLTGVLFVIVLKQLQVEGSQIAWALTALSVGIGFGLQDFVRSSAAGIMMLVERPLKVGDELNVEGGHGMVENITLRATTVRMADNSGVVIPNSQLQSGLISGRVVRGEALRLSVRIGVAYGTDLARAANLVRAVLATKSFVRPRPAADVLIDDTADSAVMLLVWFWVTAPGPRDRQVAEVREAILLRFQQERIEIPFPQLDVRMNTDGKSGA